MKFATGDRVSHLRFGTGTVLICQGITTAVHFFHGIENCLTGELDRQLTLAEALDRSEWPAPLPAVCRVLGEAIRSVNDAWGVFSRSKIHLLPHQLWVCRQVNRDRPARWLVADDVGLGKTIEAGLILMPLIARGAVDRLLILCPASLVEQWLDRMSTMFGIRLVNYAPESDRPKSGFWATSPRVVASFHTLRDDVRDRHQRMLDAAPWDMVIVDEAHHLNADPVHGPTKGWELVRKLDLAGKIGSMVFFSGTPHRGKDYGFLSLMKLLRPDTFDPKKPIAGQLPHLRHCMIRNNKQSVTDLEGRKLFRDPIVRSETFTYSPEEAAFYAKMSAFLLRGESRVRELGERSNEGRAVKLVLTTMQKLASSSIAAIRKALHKRLARFRAVAPAVSSPKPIPIHDEDDDSTDEFEQATADAVDDISMQLMENEIAGLRDLIATIEAIPGETKIARILDLVADGGAFAGRSVLFFTEYKATQALLLHQLRVRFGPGSVAFINGDESLPDIPGPGGVVGSVAMKRQRAAEMFNAGSVRFLISTEAGGEGIDLQARCYSLVHVDLPWNPMRLHQRVGRLNRYGQKERVEVYTMRNPDTVESRIWGLLEEKIGKIMAACNTVMAEPEDLLQLVLGLASPGLIRGVFADAADAPADGLKSWFDARTASFGGRDAVDTVRDLVGHCEKFDFGTVSPQIPRLDLPDLKTFFRLMLSHQNRAMRDDGEGGVSFLTPDSWANFPGCQREYRGLHFARDHAKVNEVLGAGDKIFDRAVETACGFTELAAVLPVGFLERTLFVFRVTDRVTAGTGAVRSILFGVEGEGETRRLHRDWELIRDLNAAIAGGRDLRRATGVHRPDRAAILAQVESATQWVTGKLPELDHPYKVAEVSIVCVLIPQPAYFDRGENVRQVGTDSPFDETGVIDRESRS